MSVQVMNALHGKEFARKLERAEMLYEGANYPEALSIFLELFKADSSHANICYKIGSCYLKKAHQHSKAVYYLKKAVLSAAVDYSENDMKEKRAPLKAYKLLAEAYHLDNQFDDAVSNYKKYRQVLLNYKIAGKDVLKDIARKIEICLNAKDFFANPVNVKVTNMGAEINSPFPDYSPRLSADQQTMIFTSRRPGNTGGKTYDGGQFFEDIYISHKKNGQWLRAENMSWPVNTVGNEAAVSLSADGQEMLIYKDDMGNGNIYSSRLEGDKWSMPVKLNSNINSPSWEPSAHVSADGNTIYFVSDRPGGYGGTDIYKSRKDPGGDWGKAENLGPAVNTSEDEYSPFIHADGVTLYFSSKGHKTMGSFDVFYSTLLDGKSWSEPVNAGYPVNSTGDDAFFIVSPDKKMAYYSSYRNDGFGEKDNYTVFYPDVNEAPVSLLKGTLRDGSDNVIKNGIITITEKETNETIVHRSNSKTGEYVVVLPAGNYNISYEGDGLLFYSLSQYVGGGNSYAEEKVDVKLQSMNVGAKTTLNNIFFEFDEAILRAASKAELDKLYKLLSDNPGLSVEVSGYADSKGTNEYNEKLSLERAISVARYLEKKGIEKERITPAGMGKDVSGYTKNDNNAGGLKPSGRRVELKIIAAN